LIDGDQELIGVDQQLIDAYRKSIDGDQNLIPFDRKLIDVDRKLIKRDQNLIPFDPGANRSSVPTEPETSAPIARLASETPALPVFVRGRYEQLVLHAGVAEASLLAAD
jgi:hypothetical protein